MLKFMVVRTVDLPEHGCRELYSNIFLRMLCTYLNVQNLIISSACRIFITSGTPILLIQQSNLSFSTFWQLQQSNCSSKQLHFQGNYQITSQLSFQSNFQQYSFSASRLSEIQQTFNNFAKNKTVSKIFTEIFENFFSRFQKFAHKGLFENPNTR